MIDKAAKRKYQLTFGTPTKAAQPVLDRLIAGNAVAVSLPVHVDSNTNTSNWELATSFDTGKVFMPPPGSKVDGGHAVCIVGFVPDKKEKSGGHFIFRNSWGVTWGAQGGQAHTITPAPGYGFVSATFIENFLWELSSV